MGSADVGFLQDRRKAMQDRNNATITAQVDGGQTAAREQADLLDVKSVARKLGCSWRHVYRLSDSGRMPRPLKLGALVRWRRQEIEAWIADGCPTCRQGGGFRRRS